DDEDDPGGNYQHIVGTGEVTAEEVEEVLRGHVGPPADYSDSSGDPLVYGWTSSGKHIVVIYRDESDADLVVIRPRTAYPVSEYGGGAMSAGLSERPGRQLDALPPEKRARALAIIARTQDPEYREREAADRAALDEEYRRTGRIATARDGLAPADLERLKGFL